MARSLLNIQSLAAKLTGHLRLAWQFLRHGPPSIIVRFQGGIGDQLLCSAIFRELRQRGRKRFWMLTRNPELFLHNPDLDYATADGRRIVEILSKPWGGVTTPHYAKLIYAEGRQILPPHHVIGEMCRLAGLDGTVRVRPYLTLTDDERRAGRLRPKQIAVHTSGLTSYSVIQNKEWYPDRFNSVMKQLRGRYDIVQIGSAGDPPIDGALDLRGKTSLRQTAAILSQSALFVGLEGFLMHLARAVDCRSVIVFGGRSLPTQFGYPCNENLYTPLPCSPCLLYSTCDYDRRCMSEITVDHVLAACERALARGPQPLEVETLDLDHLPQAAPRSVTHLPLAPAHAATTQS